MKLSDEYLAIDWTAAECLGSDPELFFADKGSNVTMAAGICRRCQILWECREYAIAHERRSYWGGLTVRERERIRRQRGILLRTPSIRLTNGTP